MLLNHPLQDGFWSHHATETTLNKRPCYEVQQPICPLHSLPSQQYIIVYYFFFVITFPSLGLWISHSLPFPPTLGVAPSHFISGFSSSSSSSKAESQILFPSISNSCFHLVSRVFNIVYILMVLELFLQSRHLLNFRLQYPTTNSTSQWRWLRCTSDFTFPKLILIFPALNSVLSLFYLIWCRFISLVIQAKNTWSHFESFLSYTTFSSGNCNESSFNVDWN